jgi:hypothetical protein
MVGRPIPQPDLGQQGRAATLTPAVSCASIEPWGRWLFYQSTHSRVAIWTCSRLCHGPRLIHSVLCRPTVDSARASWASPTDPTEGSTGLPWQSPGTTVVNPADEHAVALGVAEFIVVHAVKLGGPNDEARRGHPLYGRPAQTRRRQDPDGSHALPEAAAVRRGLPAARRRRRNPSRAPRSGRPGRAPRGDTHIQRGRPDPARRHFGKATTRTRHTDATRADTQREPRRGLDRPPS